MEPSAGLQLVLASLGGADPGHAVTAGRVIADAQDVLVAGVVIFVASSMGFAVASLVILPLLSRLSGGVSHRRQFAIPIAPLLTAKLCQPRPRPDAVPRPRLVEQLSRGLEHRLIVVSSQAGSGKTTLLGQWMLQRKYPAAYLSLDEGDNVPARFLSYFIAALQTIYPQAGGSALVLLQSSTTPPINSSLSMLLNDINGVPGDFALILDDYHMIEAQAVHDAVTFLIEHAPPQMHIIIASRRDPSLPLARLRASALMTELRASDLRFTPDETAMFTNQVMGLRLDMEQVEALHARTDGWIAGLQLAVVSMRGQDNLVSGVRAVTGSHPHIAGYLADEVFRPQRDDVQTFLLQTSILTRLTAALCEAVTGQTDGRARLESMVQANVFIRPLDAAQQWYGYHPLFAEFLRDRLRQSQPQHIVRLHTSAAHWYEQHGMVADAIDHALAASDLAFAARLIEQTTPAMLENGQAAIVQRWLAALPDAIRYDLPELTGDLRNVSALLAAQSGVQPRIAVDARPPDLIMGKPLVEPLSERELEVLRLITMGMSNQEIAQELTVTLNTIKTHVRSIYGKLNARSRVQAVTRARQLQVLQ